MLEFLGAFRYQGFHSKNVISVLRSNLSRSGKIEYGLNTYLGRDIIWMYLNPVDIPKATLSRDMSMGQARNNYTFFKIFVRYGSIEFMEPPSQNAPLFFQKVLCIYRLCEFHVRSLRISFTSENLSTFSSSRIGAFYKWKIGIADSRFDKESDLGWTIHQA